MSLRFSLYRLALIPFAVLLASPPASAAYFDEREDVKAFIAEVAARDHLDADELTQALAGAEPLPKVIELIKPPSQPGIRSWKRYRARFMDAPRISGGIQFWQTYQADLERASRNSGVPPEIIVAIIGVETVYGRNMGNFSVLSALATLAFDYPPRATLFRRELEQLFLLAHEQHQAVAGYRGSYAGAIGLPQFLPSSLRSVAVDGDNDGIIDLRNNPKDAIYSVANYLAQQGWVRGGEIARPVIASKPDMDLKPLLDAGLLPTLDANLLTQYGLGTGAANGKDLAALIDLVTPDEATQYWLGYQNFYAITRYNQSSFYAMSVFDLAQTLKMEMQAREEMGKTTASAAQATPHKSSKKKH